MRRTLAATAVLILWAHGGVAHAQTTTGRVDAARSLGPPRIAVTFRTSARTDISATLHWKNAGSHLDLFLARRRRDGGWRRIEAATSVAAHPQRLSRTDARPAQYRLIVRAASGQSPFRLVFDAVRRKPAYGPSGPFLTLLFSRSEITAAPGCTPESGALDLMTAVAPVLRARGLRPTGTVETGITRDHARTCIHYGHTLAASWSDLATLRDRYGWTFVSHGRTYATNLASMTPQQQWSDTCGSLIDLERHGHWRGDGLFAYPDNGWSAAVQSQVVDTCFAFGRRFGTRVTTEAEAMRIPHWQRTWGISGGRCNDPARRCSQMHTEATYRSPLNLQRALRYLGVDDWLTLQSYVFVTGNRPGEWNCRARSWRDHWTADVERYCWGDYLRILRAIPAGVTVTDPKTVAQAWGRDAYRVPAP